VGTFVGVFVLGDPMSAESRKDLTLKFRIDDLTLKLLDQAQSYVEINRSKFIRQSIREKAESIIAEYDQTRFSESDWHLFFDSLDTPEKPTERMKKAAKRYSQIVNPDEV